MTFSEWFDDFKDELEQAIAFSISDLPDEPAALKNDLSRSNREAARMGLKLSEAESFVLKSHASAVFAVRKNNPELTAEERKIVAKSDEDYIIAVKVRDDIHLVVRSLRDKSFSIMNLRNTTDMRTMSES